MSARVKSGVGELVGAVGEHLVVDAFDQHPGVLQLERLIRAELRVIASERDPLVGCPLNGVHRVVVGHVCELAVGGTWAMVLRR